MDKYEFTVGTSLYYDYPGDGCTDRANRCIVMPKGMCLVKLRDDVVITEEMKLSHWLINYIEENVRYWCKANPLKILPPTEEMQYHIDRLKLYP